MRWTLALVAAGIMLFLALRWADSPKPQPQDSPRAQRQGAPSAGSTATRTSPPKESTGGDKSADRSADESADKSAAKRERERMRERIHAALLAREHAVRNHDDDDGDDAGAGSRERATKGDRPSENDEPAPTPGDLKDRSGNHGYLLKVMNEELMPLADECYALARHTQPDLQGLLVLNLEIVGDDEIGGIIELVEPGEGNELVDPTLLECMRESLFSTTLPAPEETGRDALSLSMPLSPDEA